MNDRAGMGFRRTDSGPLFQLATSITFPWHYSTINSDYIQVKGKSIFKINFNFFKMPSDR